MRYLNITDTVTGDAVNPPPSLTSGHHWSTERMHPNPLDLLADQSESAIFPAPPHPPPRAPHPSIPADILLTFPPSHAIDSTHPSASTHPSFPSIARAQAIARAAMASHKQSWHVLNAGELEVDLQAMYGPRGLVDPELAGGRFRVLMLLHMAEWVDGAQAVLKDGPVLEYEVFRELAMRDLRAVTLKEDLVSRVLCSVA